MLCVVENVRKKHLDWINFILETKGWKPHHLASVSGVDASTLSRFFDRTNPLSTRTLNSRSVELIAEASGIPPFETNIPQPIRGVADRESEAYEAEKVTSTNEAVKALQGARNGVDAWVMRSRALEAAGYLPGDILVVDMNAAPQSGDVVCAEILDRSGKPEMVMRILERPFLVAATFDPSLFKPMLIDGDRVTVRGVVIASFRERRAVAA